MWQWRVRLRLCAPDEGGREEQVGKDGSHAVQKDHDVGQDLEEQLLGLGELGVNLRLYKSAVELVLGNPESRAVRFEPLEPTELHL